MSNYQVIVETERDYHKIDGHGGLMMDSVPSLVEIAVEAPSQDEALWLVEDACTETGCKERCKVRSVMLYTEVARERMVN